MAGAHLFGVFAKLSLCAIFFHSTNQFIDDFITPWQDWLQSQHLFHE